MGIWNWSRTAASNDTADPAINLREGMAPSQVNNSARATLAALASYRDDMSGAIITGGASSAYTVATYSSVVDGSTVYRANVCVAFIPHATNAASPTLNVDSGGALPIRGQASVALGAGVLVLGTPYVVVLNAAKTEWMLHGYMPELTTVPLGVPLPYVGATAPNSYFVLAYGQAISRTTYASLFALCATAHGVGDGSTTFNIPDMRGRTIFGKDDMGGVAASRLTTAGSGVDGATAGAVGGAQNVTLARANLPDDSITSSSAGAHRHLLFATSTNGGSVAADEYVNRQRSSGGGADNYLITSAPSPEPTLGLSSLAADHTHTSSLNGGVTQTVVNKMPPAIVLPYIMRVL